MLEKTIIMYLLSAACGTYVIILDVIIISEQKVIIFIYWDYLVSSDVSLLKKNYIPLLIYNSDELVMSRGNRKIFTYAFCKSGALQIIPTILENKLLIFYSHNNKDNLYHFVKPMSHFIEDIEYYLRLIG
jgi:hypothetical protein